MTRNGRRGETENEQFRRRIKNRAVGRALAMIREKYRPEFDDLLAQAKRDDPEMGRQLAFKRASRALRDLHRHEYDVLLVVTNARLQEEEGYEPQQHIGHANLLLGNGRRLDTSAHSTGE